MAIPRTEPPKSPPAYGLFRADEFRLTRGECANSTDPTDSVAIAQARWLFRHETVATPLGDPVAGFDARRDAQQDLQQWNAQNPPGTTHDYPTLIWIGAPEQIHHARLTEQGAQLHTAQGTIDLALTPRLPSNRSFYNVDSSAFFRQRTLHLRGQTIGDQFLARSIWPEDFRLDPAAPLASVDASPGALRQFVREQAQGGAQSPFLSQPVWQRTPDAARQRAGKPLIGLMLNGAQGDDDEAHAGHFALFCGRVGTEGEMHDWLVANYYTLDLESEKGILPAMQPMEGYLADLNSGQSWYRPSYLLVATLQGERTASHLSSALARVFNHFYRRDFSYQHAAANCAGISISTLRSIGWNIPKLGAISWLKALIALPIMALCSASLKKGKAVFDYYTEEQTRLLPAVAFEQTAADLLRLVDGKLTRPLTAYEKMLRDDVEEIILVRIPQFPSSREWGNYPVAGVDEFRHRVPKDPAMQQTIPLAPRHFPDNPGAPRARREKSLRSDYAVAGYSAGLLLLGAWLLRRLSTRSREDKH